MNVTYSIIIPHRNSFELLKRAIASVPDRNDIQIIVIDNSPNELDFSSIEVGGNVKFTILYSSIEKGAGHARNVGLKEAIGEWLLFLDADDFFMNGAFEHFDKYIHSDYDIVYFSSTSLYSDTMKKAVRHKYYSRIVNDFAAGKEITEDKLRYTFVSPWSKLIRNKLIKENAIQFDEVPASNDLMFSIRSGYFAKKIHADNFPAYCITVNSGSLTTSISKKNNRSRFYVSIQQHKFMIAIGRSELRSHVFKTVIKSLRFGIKEFFWYVSLAKKEKVNIFLGINNRVKNLYQFLNK